MPPRYSLPDWSLWSVIVSRVPGRLIGLLKLGRSGRSRFNTSGARHRGRRSPPIKRLQNNRSSQLDQNSRHNIQGNYKKKLRCRAATWEELSWQDRVSDLGTLQRRIIVRSVPLRIPIIFSRTAEQLAGNFPLRSDLLLGCSVCSSGRDRCGAEERSRDAGSFQPDGQRLRQQRCGTVRTDLYADCHKGANTEHVGQMVVRNRSAILYGEPERRRWVI